MRGTDISTHVEKVGGTTLGTCLRVLRYPRYIGRRVQIRALLRSKGDIFVIQAKRK